MRTKALDQHIGRNVRVALWDAHITQRQLADRLRVDETIVSKMLRGNRAWSISDLIETADAVGVPVADLLPEAMRQNLVSVTSGDPDSVTRGRSGTGWFRSNRAKPHRPPHHGALFPPGSPVRVTLLRPTG
jgi:transcriptional regulator with XRE-family HTH domain